ncbi:hypothetical protein ACGFZ9_50590 [Streptomyces mirabilis]|uniref:hypothetical protein n=1 Tax=Streptomyces mirabilis TaxID=68239 RepID=UPI0037241B97
MTGSGDERAAVRQEPCGHVPDGVVLGHRVPVEFRAGQRVEPEDFKSSETVVTL